MKIIEYFSVFILSQFIGIKAIGTGNRFVKTLKAPKDDDTEKGQKVRNVQEKIGFDWPMGIIPYYFDLSSYDYIVSRRVRLAMNLLEVASCVRFKALLLKPMDNSSWIHITNPDGTRKCVHETRSQGNGENMLVLGLDCLQNRDILHSLLHAIGFRDEVSHPQRDQYIRVLWENIQPEYRPLYRIQVDAQSKALVEYDPTSIMHFHDRAFTRNGHATIAPLVPGLMISPSDALSHLDKMKLRLLFGHECNRRKVGDLLDTCKTAMKKRTSAEVADGNPDGGTKGEIGSLVEGRDVEESEKDDQSDKNDQNDGEEGENDDKIDENDENEDKAADSVDQGMDSKEDVKQSSETVLKGYRKPLKPDLIKPGKVKPLPNKFKPGRGYPKSGKRPGKPRSADEYIFGSGNEQRYAEGSSEV